MGERKGQNKYYPPDFDYKKHGSLNGYHGVHALRERGKKAHLGILTIRFEMPFNVWCLGCGNHIGMGVRYNAEKKKVGNYFTTPIYEFTMKCALCPQKFTIRTDPKNYDYEMVDGCRRQERRFDSGELNNVAPVDRNESFKLDADAMYRREQETKDKNKSLSVAGTINKLEWIQERMKDDYTANCVLRNQFRSEKKHLLAIKESDDQIKQRLSLGIPLQPEKDEDKIMAKQMLLYKNLGTGKKSVPTNPTPLNPKKFLERSLFKRGPAVFDAKNGLHFDPNNTKDAKTLGSMIKHKTDLAPSTSEKQATDEELEIKRPKSDVEPPDSVICKSNLLVNYGTDSD